jgi:hypothetical protein
MMDHPSKTPEIMRAASSIGIRAGFPGRRMLGVLAGAILTMAAAPVALGIKGPGIGGTKLTAPTLVANYWISQRFRTTFNGVLNHFGGDTSYATSLNGNDEHALLFRLAIAL